MKLRLILLIAIVVIAAIAIGINPGILHRAFPTPDSFTENFQLSAQVAEALNAELLVVRCVNGEVYNLNDINPSYTAVNTAGTYCYQWHGIDAGYPKEEFGLLFASMDENMHLSYSLGTFDQLGIHPSNTVAQGVDEWQYNRLLEFGLSVSK